MKKPTAILSHVCIFALGCAVAFVSMNDEEKDTASVVSADERSRSGAGSLPGAERHGSRERREGADRAARQGSSPRESLAKINLLADTYERQRSLMNYFDGLSFEQFAEVADEFRKMPHYDNEGSEMELLFLAWAKKDPVAALDYIAANPDTSRNRDEVLMTWAGADPAAAEQWALTNHDGDGANLYLAAVIKGIALTDMPSASRLTQSMPPGKERGEAIDAVTKALLMSGTEAAFAFPETIADEHLKGSFVVMISQNLARRDPQAAADWIATMDGKMQERASGNVAGRLARLDLEKATEFVSSLQPSARANAAAATVPVMSSKDIAGTAKWVSTLSGTPGYDKVVESFVWSCDERAPEQSAAWISGVSDTGQQMQLYFRMLGGWAKKDPNAVRTWVAENQVPENVRRRFSR
jgi:hypothetical protein